MIWKVAPAGRVSVDNWYPILVLMTDELVET